MTYSTRQDICTLHKAGCYLGESPFWHNLRQSCLWVDIETCCLYELKWSSGQIRTWKLNEKVSFIIEHENGHILLGLQRGVASFDLDNSNIKWLKLIDVNDSEYRCNDGYCDPAGRIWLGVMHIDAKPSAGALYCLYPDLHLQKMISGLTIPNGLAWSTELGRLYFVDSTSRTVNSYLLNEENNGLVHEKVIIQLSEDTGTPDGITLDSEGMLWIAIYGGFRVIRCNPANGSVLYTIRLPVPNVTNCCFAGPGLDNLVITTAKEHLSKEELLKYPQSGDVFMVKKIGVTGIRNFVSDLK